MEPVWVCPTVVSLTTTEVLAALYALSDLMDEVPEPSPVVVRDELSFLVIRYGVAMIGRIADWLWGEGSNSLPESPMKGVEVPVDRSPSADRLDWCRRQVELAFGAADERRTA